jgi:hypothetical protein
MPEYFLLNQMYILVILFFASLFSIVFMIGRKLAFLKNEQALNHEKDLFELVYFIKIKHKIVINFKKHGYTLLVLIIRFYVQSMNFLKRKYVEIKNKISMKTENNTEKKEVSKFLKIIKDYKHKIREIKHNIKKEENL